MYLRLLRRVLGTKYLPSSPSGRQLHRLHVSLLGKLQIAYIDAQQFAARAGLGILLDRAYFPEPRMSWPVLHLSRLRGEPNLINPRLLVAIIG